MQELKTRINEWLSDVNAKRSDHWNANYTHKPYEPLDTKVGRKYIKLMDGTSVWGFVALQDGVNKGTPVVAGDLLKAADWRTPAKWSRGNVLAGTDAWDYYGPVYLN